MVDPKLLDFALARQKRMIDRGLNEPEYDPEIEKARRSRDRLEKQAEKNKAKREARKARKAQKTKNRHHVKAKTRINRDTRRRNRAIAKKADFYESDEWREVRYRALKSGKGCCECCAARAAPGKPLHVDHIKPRSKYPALALDLNNLQVLCIDCNLGKRAWDETDWRGD